MGYLLRCARYAFLRICKKLLRLSATVYASIRACARPLRGFYLAVTRERRVENRRTGIGLVYRVTPISGGGCASRRRHFLLLTHSLTCYSFAGNHTPLPSVPLPIYDQTLFYSRIFSITDPLDRRQSEKRIPLCVAVMLHNAAFVSR